MPPRDNGTTKESNSRARDRHKYLSGAWSAKGVKSNFLNPILYNENRVSNKEKKAPKEPFTTQIEISSSRKEVIKTVLEKPVNVWGGNCFNASILPLKHTLM